VLFPVVAERLPGGKDPFCVPIFFRSSQLYKNEFWDLCRGANYCTFLESSSDSSACPKHKIVSSALIFFLHYVVPTHPIIAASQTRLEEEGKSAALLIC
jgi:hypothetical protein